MPKNNLDEEVITKTCIYTGKQKTEHHRPTANYLDTFSKFGFSVDRTIDTKGINIETFEKASDFKIFVLSKTKSNTANILEFFDLHSHAR